MEEMDSGLVLLIPGACVPKKMHIELFRIDFFFKI